MREHEKPSDPVLFRLQPINDLASIVVSDRRNTSFVSTKPGKASFDIGKYSSKTNDSVTLVTLGRDGDIKIDAKSISRIQCAFEIDPETKVVMFYDRSSGHTTQVLPFAESLATAVMPFEPGRQPRRVYVGPGLNPVISMGSREADRVKFLIVWEYNDETEITKKIQNYHAMGPPPVPDLAKTVEEDTLPETLRATRMPTPLLGQELFFRHHVLGLLGQGSYGTVTKVVNVDTGKVMALKTLVQKSDETSERWLNRQTEVEVMAKVDHPCIVDLIWTQGWDTRSAEIFMGLKDGSLHSLVKSRAYEPVLLEELAKTMLHQMLQALDALASKGYIHRDVKPENILYVFRNERYYFQLGDFGLSKAANFTNTFAGTFYYVAPEVFHGLVQTPKADVWSLYVTHLWMLDSEWFRRTIETLRRNDLIHAAVVELAATERLVAELRPMAELDANRRASAAQMLVRLFRGAGLVTDARLVPPLLGQPPPALPPSPAAAPAAVTPSLGTALPHLASPVALPPPALPPSAPAAITANPLSATRPRSEQPPSPTRRSDRKGKTKAGADFRDFGPKSRLRRGAPRNQPRKGAPITDDFRVEKRKAEVTNNNGK